MSEYITDTSQVSSVWSAYGHHFLDDGGEGTVSCLRCAYMAQLVAFADEPKRGEYVVPAGEVQDCTGNTSLVHGYSGERYCHDHNSDSCSCVEHDCNCIACDS